MMQMMGARNNNMMGNPVDSDQNQPSGMMDLGSSMTQMMGSLDGKTGDEFDKAFIEAMIPHHQGAIEMAKKAQINAGHPELKKLADEIISAQEAEINLMRNWHSQWGL